MHTKLLNLVDNHYLQFCNRLILTTSVNSKGVSFSQFLSLVILLLLLPSNIIVSGVESSRYYPVFNLNVIVFSIIFTYIIIQELSVIF